MPKKGWAMILALVIFAGSAFAAERQPVAVAIDDQYLSSESIQFVEDGEVYLPLRPFAETFGSLVGWNPKSREVLIRQGKVQVDLQVDTHEVVVNGQVQTLERSPVISRGRTYLPLSFLTEVYDVEALVDLEESRVQILTDGSSIKDVRHLSEDPPVDPEDLEWLAKIVQVETNASEEMKLAVANVVLNRVKDPMFGDTVKEVIFEVLSGYVQFPPAHKASFVDVKPSEASMAAARRALLGENNIGHALFFNHRPWASKADELLKIIDGQYFYE